MESRPLPGGGYQHTLVVSLNARPPLGLEGSIEALVNLESGFQQPLVETVEELPNGSCTVFISVFSEDEKPSPEQKAALEGTKAELVWHDRAHAA